MKLLRLTSVLGILIILTTQCWAQASKPWPVSTVIYAIYPPNFSPDHSFNAITAQLGRLKQLGINVIWLLPITPMGKPVNGHPTVGSPYCVHDYYGVNTDYGTPADLHRLIARAHAINIKIIIDAVLNHTAWDNPLLTEHPEYYVHSNGDSHDPETITQAFNFSDVAQLNYANPELRAYIIDMLKFWIKTYGVDGFRFDCVDDPDGPGRMIPADFWLEVGQQLRSVNPDVLLLGECDTPDLANKPFTLEYGWRMYSAIKDAGNNGDASVVQDIWYSQNKEFPNDFRHMGISDDWDCARDVNTFGGPAGAQAAAIFDFTDGSAPLIHNGMEVGNSAGASGSHIPIEWCIGDKRFTDFYRDLIALRQRNAAFLTGRLQWLINSQPKQALTYERTGGGLEFLIEVNLSNSSSTGTVIGMDDKGWTEVHLSGTVSTTRHSSPQSFSLGPKDFAIFCRSE